MTPFNIKNYLLHTSVFDFILILLISLVFYLFSIIYTNQLKVTNKISFSKFVCSGCYFEYNLQKFLNLIFNSIKGYSCINCKRRFSIFSLFLFFATQLNKTPNIFYSKRLHMVLRLFDWVKNEDV